MIAPSILALVSSVAIAQTSVSSNSGPNYDCGFLSLYFLLRVEGRPVELRTLEGVLPPPSPAGYSMKELRDAARHCALNLIGVRLAEGDRAPEQPAIVFFKRRPHGHYALVRPVGHTGKLVQILDVNREPEVVDIADLSASPEWTGLALVPSRQEWPVRVAVALALGSVVVSILARLWIRGRVEGVEPASAPGDWPPIRWLHPTVTDPCQSTAPPNHLGHDSGVRSRDSPHPAPRRPGAGPSDGCRKLPAGFSAGSQLYRSNGGGRGARRGRPP